MVKRDICRNCGMSIVGDDNTWIHECGLYSCRSNNEVFTSPEPPWLLKATVAEPVPVGILMVWDEKVFSCLRQKHVY